MPKSKDNCMPLLQPVLSAFYFLKKIWLIWMIIPISSQIHPFHFKMLHNKNYNDSVLFQGLNALKEHFFSTGICLPSLYFMKKHAILPPRKA